MRIDMLKPIVTLLIVLSWSASGLSRIAAQDEKPAPASAASSATMVRAPLVQIPVDAVPLNPEKTIYLEKAQRRLLLRTKVCLREGVLEMFLCPKQTKEHESILSWSGKAKIAHAGLLALGAKSGHPVRFEPDFSPPAGDIIDIFVNWTDEKGQPQRRPAQQWIRHATFRYFEASLAKVPPGVTLGETEESLRYDDIDHKLLFFGTMKPGLKKEFLAMSSDKDYQQAVESLWAQGRFRELEADFVFAGSFFQRREDGTEVYVAEAGSLVCVANFADAMIDINMQSTASNDAGLLFEPWTERIPPMGTDVLVEFVPRK